MPSGSLPALGRRTALVTGACGSIGSEICAQLLGAGLSRLVLVDLDRNGSRLLERRLERRHPGAVLEVEIADIREPDRLLSIFERQRPQDVFHAAAQKHVAAMEQAPREAVSSNVLGTRNVVTAAVACGAERLVYISTDKAARPAGVMGASKRLGELLVRRFSRRGRSRFRAVRFGNVLGSSGSVVPIFRRQIAEGGPLRVTHPDASRYFIACDEAVSSLLEIAYGDFGELCVLEMGQPVKILDLARRMIVEAGRRPDVEIPIVYTGLGPGEKLAEDLVGPEERTRRAARGILEVDSPPPAEDLERRIAELADTLEVEPDAAVLETLRQLVPGYGAERAASRP